MAEALERDPHLSDAAIRQIAHNAIMHRLAEAMKNLGFVQRFGLGIPLAKRLLQEAGHPEMEFQVDRNNVLVNIRSA